MAAESRGTTTISITFKFHRESSSSLPAKSNANVAKVTRHCAFCLEIITTFPVKLCGGCKKRAYCSKECQVADWKITGTGQRHKNWCGVHSHGEEDVDWEVVPVPNKGLGIIAKKLLPAGYRIIVEPAFSDPNDHPGIADLEPKGSPLDVKISFNGVQGYRGKPLIAVRIARVNHSCLPNSGVCYDDVGCVEILFAQRDIQPGEEVTICYYTHFNNLGPSTKCRPDIELIQSEHPFKDDFAINQIILKRFGITCPKDCFCKNRKTRKLVTKGKRLYDEMHVSTAIGRIEDALDAGEKILEIYDLLNISWALKDDLLLHLCEIAMHNYDVFPRCVKHINEFHKIRRVILPFFDATMCEKWFKNKENVDSDS